MNFSLLLAEQKVSLSTYNDYVIKNDNVKVIVYVNVFIRMIFLKSCMGWNICTWGGISEYLWDFSCPNLSCQ